MGRMTKKKALWWALALILRRRCGCVAAVYDYGQASKEGRVLALFWS